jgi:DNA-binding transcriptional ArsR family regulator
MQGGLFPSGAWRMRRRLLSLLKIDGPATASLLAQRTSQAVGNISHHLHVLAAADLIEEVPELARDRREHWWRRTAGLPRWSLTDFADDAASDVVFRAAESLNLDYQVSLFRQWAQATDEEHARWPAGPFSTDSWMRRSATRSSCSPGASRAIRDRGPRPARPAPGGCGC